MTSVTTTPRSRAALLRRLQQLAPHLLFGTLSETYRTCGRAGCHCHHGVKHGPHLYVSFRGPQGRTQGYYVPQAVQAAVRAGVAAWQEFQAVGRTLAEVNRAQLWAAREEPTRARQAQRRGHGSTRLRSAKPSRSAAARRRQVVGRRPARDRHDARR